MLSIIRQDRLDEEEAIASAVSATLLEESARTRKIARLFVFRNDECNGICSVPEGYRSRCQQQFVQKRLIALEGSGNRLYTDLFWFPHGCTCQVIPEY